MDKFMSLLQLSQGLLAKVTNLNAGIVGTINTAKRIDLDQGQQANLAELESKFNGDVTIVAHSDPFGMGPFTVPGSSTIIDFTTFKGFEPVKMWMNQILGLKVDITKVGNSFNITSNEKIVVYVPNWFLTDDKIVSSKGHIFELSNDSRIGIILHEIGHWDSLNSKYLLLSTLSLLFGLIMFFTGSVKAVVSGYKYLFSKNKEEPNVKSTLYNLGLIISGLLFFFVISKLFRSFAETGSDIYSSKFGYGDDLVTFFKNVMPDQINNDKAFNSLYSLIQELIDRIKTGYPSMNWRVQDLLSNNVTENLEYVTELDTSILENLFETFLIKLNVLVSKLKPLNNIVSIRRIRSINENINILIYQSYE